MGLFLFIFVSKNLVIKAKIFITGVFLLLLVNSCIERRGESLSRNGNTTVKVEELKTIALSNVSKRDSVLKAIVSLKEDSIKGNILLDLSYHFYSINDSLNFRFWNQATVVHSFQSRDTITRAKAHWDLANFYYKKKVLDSSYYFYNLSHKLFKKKNDQYHAARMLINLATIQRDIKDFQNSEITTIQALRMLKPLEKKYQLYLAYNNLGVTSNHLEQYQDALNFHHESLKLAEELEDDLLVALSLNNIGVVYKNLGQYSEAIKNYRQAQAIDSLKFKYPELEGMVIDNLAYSRLKLGDTLEVEKHLLEALTLRKNINHFSGIATSYLHLGDYYLNSLDSSKAYGHYQKSRKISKEKGLNEEFLESTLGLARLGGSSSGEYYEDYIQKSTEFQRQERAVKNRFAKIRFQTDELLAETKRLTEQKIWIGAVSLLAIMSLLLAYYLNLQRTKNKELAFEREQRIANEEIYKLMLKQQSKLEEGRQRERKRISSDLHDGVLGKMYGTRLNLEFLNIKMSPTELKKFNSLTTELQEIEKEVREISHDLVSENFFQHSSFISMVEGLLYEKSQRGATVFHLEHDEDIPWDDVKEEVKLDLYRILQEATQNTIKHADAKEVLVKIGKWGSGINISITDNGSGFLVNKKKKGIGLSNIDSRVKKWNGKFFIHSLTGQGTEIIIQIPNLL